MNIQNELIELIRKGNVTLFAGAGLSIGAGLPGWPGLIHPLALDISAHWPNDVTDLTTDHLLNAVQYYENRHGRNVLIHHLRDMLDKPSVQPTSVHRLIASQPFRVIFSTNYDNLIEQALRQVGQRFNLIVNDIEIAFFNEDCIQIVKLCGDLQRPDSIVLTKRDFSTYLETHRRLAERLRTTLESKTALFLGYSLQDPFFNQIWDNIGLDFGKYRRMGYAVLFDARSLEIDDLQRRGIHVINLDTNGKDKTQLLLDWLSLI